MQFSLRRTVAPQELPVSLRQAKRQLELPLSSTERDEQILLLLDAAVSNFENMTRRAMLPQTWVFESTDPICAVELPRSPLKSITSVESRELLTDSWVAVAAEDYSIEDTRQPARLTWVNQIPRRVRVTYVAGFNTATEVPTNFKLTILQLVTHYFENRGDVAATLPVSLKGMIESQRAGTLAGYWYA